MAKTVTSKNGYASRGSSKKRPGIHSKSKASKLKSSKLYKKMYRGQG
jgi:hypothetical protein